MIGPMDYSLGVASPFQSALSGYQIGAGIRNDQAKAQQQQMEMQAQQAKLQAQQQTQADLAELSRNPNASGADYARVMTRNPQLSKQLGEAWGAMSTAQQQSRLQQGAQAYAAVLAGRPDVAEDMFRQRAAAARNSGSEDLAKQEETMAGLLKSNPDVARTSMGLLLSSQLGPDKFAETFAKLGGENRANTQEARTAELHPLELRQKTAEASGKESDATVKAEEAKYAPKRVSLEIEKLGAELGLTTAQIGQAKASAAASYASANASNSNAAKTRREMAEGGAGRLPPDKAMEAEAKLRREYSDQTKGFQEVREAYRRVRSSNDDAVGDLSLIFGYMKMLDPGSVVREGEFATAQNAAGIPDRMRNVYNRAISGERLTPGQRKAFAGQAGKLFDSAQQQEKTVRTGLERIATGYGIKKENIFYDPSNAPEDAPRAGAAAAAPASRPAASGPSVGAVEGGYRFKGGDPSKQSNWERAR